MSQIPPTIAAVDAAMTGTGSTVSAQSTSDKVGEPATAATPASTGGQKPHAKSDQYPHHVLFVVHGMGRQLEEFGKYERNVAYLVENTKMVLQSQFHHLKTDVHIIPIEWHAKLHSMVDQRMALASLRTVPKVRLVMNDYFSDILYYFNNHFGSEIVRIIVDELNEAYSTFMAKHPDFNGKIAVYALSLGGIAMFDILTCMDDDELESEEDKDKEKAKSGSTASNSISPEGKNSESMDTHGTTSTSPPAKKAKVRKQDQPKFKAEIPKLKFRPHILFTVGSPVGAVIVMRNLEWEYFHPPDDILHHNLFHPFDPLAYRIEPLIDPIFAAIPAVTLTSTGNSQLFPISLPSLLPSLPESISSFWETRVPALPIPSIPTLSTLSQMTQTLKAGRWMPGVGGSGSGGTNDRASGESTSIETQDPTGEGKMTRNANGDGQPETLLDSESTAARLRKPPKRSYLSGTADSNVSITEAIAAATVATYFDQKDSGSATADPLESSNSDLMLNCDISTTTTGPSDTPISPTRRRPSFGPRRISSRVEDEVKEVYNSSSTCPIEKVMEVEEDLTSTTTQAASNIIAESVLSAPGIDTQLHAHKSEKMGLEEVQGLEDIQAAHMKQEKAKQDKKSKRVTIEEDEQTNERPEDPSSQEKPIAEDVDTARSPIHVRGRATKVPYRIDHVLQETRVDQYTNEYLLGMRSHFRYWDNRDIAYHILKTMLQPGDTTEGQILDLEPEMPAPVIAPKSAKEAAEAKAKASAEAYRQSQDLGHRKSYSFSFMRGQDIRGKGNSSVADVDTDDNSYYDKDRGRGYGSSRDGAESLSGYRFKDLDMNSAADVPFSSNTLYQNSPFAKRGSTHRTAPSTSFTSRSTEHPYQGSSSSNSHVSESQQSHGHDHGQGGATTSLENDTTDQNGSSPAPTAFEEGFVVPDLARPPRLHHRSSRIE